VTDLSHMPPIPRDAYPVVRTLIRSGQMPESRVAELMRDDEFRAWMTDLAQLSVEELTREVGAAVLRSETLKKASGRDAGGRHQPYTADPVRAIEAAREKNQALFDEIFRRLDAAEQRIAREKLDMAIHRNLRDGLKAADDPLRLRMKRLREKENA
jgi:hypothetical protein